LKIDIVALKRYSLVSEFDFADILREAEGIIFSVYKNLEKSDDSISSAISSDSKQKIRVSINSTNGLVKILDVQGGKKKDITPKSFEKHTAFISKEINKTIRNNQNIKLYNEYKEMIGCSVFGTVVKQSRTGDYLVELRKGLYGILPVCEQSEADVYERFKQMHFLIVDVQLKKRVTVVLSRTHYKLVEKLFELEVPEIRQGFLEIVAVAREPGSRSKVAVKANTNINPIGTLVGMKNERINAVINELSGEKIDIIEYDSYLPTFVKNALSPAEILSIAVFTPPPSESDTAENDTAENDSSDNDSSENDTSQSELKRSPEKSFAVHVAPDKISLAIGEDAQNIRLAARLTGTHIDVV
jgi:N utilization substance protein A